MLAIAFTITKASKLPLDFSPNGFHNFISLYGDYSLLFAASFIVINVQLVVKQQTIAEEENKKKWKVEETNASLIQCQAYLNDIQTEMKTFLRADIHSGMVIEWPGLVEVTRLELERVYPRPCAKFQKMDSETFIQAVTLLYKLEAFASILIHGIADIEVAKKVIGSMYCRQIGSLIGTIAYLRTESHLFQNILELYAKWKQELNLDSPTVSIMINSQ